MEKLFVPYKIAKQLKETGFSEPCFGRYIYDEFNFEWYLVQAQQSKPESTAFMFDKNHASYNYVTAPLYQQVVDWFREKHKVVIKIDVCELNCIYAWVREQDSNNHLKIKFDSDDHTDYYTCFNEAINEALKLI